MAISLSVILGNRFNDGRVEWCDQLLLLHLNQHILKVISDIQLVGISFFKVGLTKQFRDQSSVIVRHVRSFNSFTGLKLREKGELLLQSLVLNAHAVQCVQVVMRQSRHNSSIVARLLSSLVFSLNEHYLRKTLFLNGWLLLIMVPCIWRWTALLISRWQFRWCWCLFMRIFYQLDFLLRVVHNIIVVKKHRKARGTSSNFLLWDLRTVSFKFRIIQKFVIECFWLYLNRWPLALELLRYSQIWRAGILWNWRDVVSNSISDWRWR